MPYMVLPLSFGTLSWIHLFFVVVVCKKTQTPQRLGFPGEWKIQRSCYTSLVYALG